MVKGLVSELTTEQIQSLRVVQFTFITNMILVLPMIYFFEALGLAYTVLISQFVHMFFNLKYYRITLQKETI